MSLKNCHTADLVLLQISDLHIFANADERFDDFDTSASLQDVLDLIEAHHPVYDVIVVTGDLVQTASDEAYQNVLELLRPLNHPVYTLPGNHDDPEDMQRLFDGTPLKTAPYSDHDLWRIIYLNSWKANSHGGQLDDTALEALDHALASAGEQHILIALHHHPVSINSPWMDTMMLENPHNLFNRIEQDTRVKGIIWGHIHQQFESEKGHIKLMGTPSTCAQFEPGATAFSLDEMQPGYRWLRLSADGNIESGIHRVPPSDAKTD